MNQIKILCFSLLIFTSCEHRKSKDLKNNVDYKEKLQGLWEDQPDGAAYFLIRGDSIFYPHHDFTPSVYVLNNDTIIENHWATKKQYKYLIQKISNDSLIMQDLKDKAIIKLHRRE